MMMRFFPKAPQRALGVLATLLLSSCDAFAPPHAMRHHGRAFSSTPYSSRGIGMAMSLRYVFDELCDTLVDQLSLKATDFAPTYHAQEWSSETASGTADWWDEYSPRYLTGVSILTRYNDPAVGLAEELTINVWMGPSFDVPHLLLTFGEAAEGEYHITADYVPRGATVLGSDPQYWQTYYADVDVQAAWKAAYPPIGVESSIFPLRPPYEAETRLLASPLRISVVGLTDEQCATMARRHVSRFLVWLKEAETVPARSRGAFNLRDDKLRQFYFRGQMQQQTRLLGPELGRTIAVVNTGPTAEAYVGGGS